MSAATLGLSFNRRRPFRVVRDEAGSDRKFDAIVIFGQRHRDPDLGHVDFLIEPLVEAFAPTAVSTVDPDDDFRRVRFDDQNALKAVDRLVFIEFADGVKIACRSSTGISIEPTNSSSIISNVPAILQRSERICH